MAGTETRFSITTVRRAAITKIPQVEAREDRVIKSVVQTSISRGMKRRRRDSELSSISAHGQMDSKRARSLKQSDASDEWTKAELLARYKALEEAHAAALDGQDESSQLREDYTSLRRQLKNLREQDETMRVNVQHQTPVPLAADNELAPSPRIETPVSSPLRPNLANVISCRRSTLDDSLQDCYNKQPTPTSDSPRHAEADDVFGENNPNIPLLDNDDTFTSLNGLVTPTATPSIRRLPLPSPPADSRPQRDISSLRSELATCQSELHTLRSAHDQLVAEKNALDEILSSRRPLFFPQLADREGLGDHMGDLDRAVNSVKIRLEKLPDKTLIEKLRKIVASEESFRRIVQDATDQLSESETRYQDLQSRHGSLQLRMNTTTTGLAQIREHPEAIPEEETSEERNRAKSCAADSETHPSDIKVSMDTLQAELNAANSMVQEKEATISRLTLALRESEDRERIPNPEGASLNATIATLQSGLADKNMDIEGLRNEAHDNAEKLHSLERAILQKDTAITKLHGIQEIADEQLSLLTLQLHTLKEKCAGLEFTLAEVQCCLDQKTSDVVDLKAGLVTKEQAYELLIADLASTKLNRDVLQSELSRKLIELSSIQAELASTQAAHHEEHGRLEEIRHEKATQEEELLKRLAAAETGLCGSQKELQRLQSTLEAVQNTRTDLESALSKRDNELASADVALQAERELAHSLRNQLQESLAKLQDAEHDADQLRGAKLQDEESILVLKETFEHLQKLEMEVLTQAKRKVRRFYFIFPYAQTSPKLSDASSMRLSETWEMKMARSF
ncbi:hypothetical protein EIP86_009703 [Pleurotus ostreatoroseus]|nr:hypothetical protein EIP86_009703 [Pleurotus ostreatoroseus]